MKLRRNKKGNDLLYLFVTITIIVVMLPVFNIFMSHTKDAFNGADVSQQAKDTTNNMMEGYISTSDFIIISVIFALYIGSLILAFFLDTHPIFMIGGILLMIIIVWLSMIYANGFAEFTSSGSLGEEINSNFPMTHFFMNWMAEINIGFTVLLLILMYYKSRWQTEY